MTSTQTREGWCRQKWTHVDRGRVRVKAMTSTIKKNQHCIIEIVVFSSCKWLFRFQQELNYRKQIARQLRPQYVEGIYRPKYYTVTLKSRLRVTHGHWKRNHWTDHTRLTISWVVDIWRWILPWPWCGLEVTQGHWKLYHLKAWVRFPIRLP